MATPPDPRPIPLEKRARRSSNGLLIVAAVVVVLVAIVAATGLFGVGHDTAPRTRGAGAVQPQDGNPPAR
jgi:hypothetical protein